ncbi:hypothetical protein FBU31_001788 [Coemansia sp. 'formosensis']|nr:hypothetical protein FBU31_001788 [Coemansia sp. 'formosensis']
MLSSALYEDYVFPQARRFNLTLSWDNYNDGDSDVYGNIDSLAAKANLSAFVQRIKYMVPLVNEVSVNPDDHHLRFGGIASHHLGDVISQLYCLANRVSYYCRDYSYIIKEVMFDEICNLASVVYDGEGLGNQFTHLARQNAPTLQSLTIYTHDEELSTSNLIRDVGGSCVVYPCLRKLKLSMEYDIDESISFGSNVPVLFPRLQHLGLGGNYAFDKYVFFKGNAASLECMSVSLDSSMVHMIRRYNLFTPTSHPNLRNVKVTFCSDFIPTLFPAATDAIQFALDIGPGAPVREISTSIFAKTLLPVYPFLGLHTCTQVLSLGHTPLVLWDAIVLIQSLHLLTDLHAGAVSLGTIPDGVTRKALPAYVISKYAPMGQRFRCWHLVNICGNSVSSTVECLLLLALVCPNFDYSSPFVFRCESYRKPMQDALASDMFKDHASRLQRRQ